MALKKICNKPGCTKLIDYSDKYCEKHVFVDKVNEADRQKNYDKYRRDQKSKAFYDSPEWRKTRQIVLVRDNYLCQDCLDKNKITPYDVVDHIIPIKVNWSLRLELSNLRLLCHSCHAIKTAEDKRKYNL